MKGSAVHSFPAAAAAGDFDAVEAMLADDVAFRSPVAFRPYPGKAITISILRAVAEVFQDLHYVRAMSDAEGRNLAYEFQATVDGLEINGCDFLTLDEHGQITDFMVMVRPLKAAQALASQMADRYPQIEAAARAWLAGPDRD
jgi:hypothetical protein